MTTMPDRIAINPASDSKLGLLSWVRELAAGAAIRMAPKPSVGADLPRGDGRVVLLIPGFSSSDWAVVGLKRFLVGLGYRACTAGLWYNPGPMPVVMRRLEKQFLSLSATEKISLIGVSLGGTLARDLAQRYPDRVKDVVTLCSPVRFPVASPLAPMAWIMAPFYAKDWVARRHAIEGPLAMPVTAIHAANDGVVLREECWLAPSPGIRNVIVAARHMTAECTPEVFSVVAETLAANC